MVTFFAALRRREPAALAVGGAVLGLLVLVLAGAVLSRTSGRAGGEGLLPPFEARTSDGATIRSSDFVGRPLFINAWASWCIPCREETPGINRVYVAYADRVTFLGLNVRDTNEPALAYAGDLGIEYPLAFDHDDLAYNALRVSGVPTSLFVDRDGTIVRRVVGPMTEQELASYLDEIVR